MQTPTQSGTYEVDVKGVVDPVYSVYNGNQWGYCANSKNAAESLANIPSKLTITNWRNLP